MIKEKKGKFRDSRNAMLRRSPSKVVQNQRCQKHGGKERMLVGRKRKLSSGPSSRNCRVLQGRRRMRGVAHDKTRCILDLGVELQSLRWIPSSFFLSFFLFASCSNPDSRWIAASLLSLRSLSGGGTVLLKF